MGPGASIGRYEVLREIGRGAMGVVYEARDPVLDRTVALKVIQPAAEGEAQKVFEERFLAEARIAAALQHPGIVVVHDVGRDPETGTLFIALELLRGRTLADLARGGPVDWPSVMRIVSQVARALHHAHLQGVVHRDIKPANIVVLPTGEAKVMDFGIARLESARQRLTTTGEFIGTPLFTAPEQARVEDVDGRADVFSLGSVAYTLLTGRAPFLAPTIPGIVHRIVHEEPDPPSRLVTGLPADVERVLARALAKDPAARYATAETLAEDAEDVFSGHPPRHAGGDDLVVVAESESPLAALVADTPAGGAVEAGGDAASDASATKTTLPPTPRRPTRARVLVAAAVLLALVGLLSWVQRPPDRPAARPPAVAGTLPRAAGPGAAPVAAEDPVPPPEVSKLRIDFDHPLRRGTLRVFVDEELVLEERISGEKRKRALVFGLHEGTFRDELEVAPGLHEVRIEISWDDNTRTERTIATFRPGTTRRLEANLGRIRRDLKLEWK